MVRELEIIAAIEAQQVIVSRHARERLAQRQVTFDEIYVSIRQGLIIEDYPEDTPYPSCLICAELSTGNYLHTVWAYDESQNLAILITVYSPDPNLWIDWRQRRRKFMLMPEKCPICGGHVHQEEVIETLQGGGNTATVKVLAGVCQLCGERYYSVTTVRRFEEIETKLKEQDLAEFELVGQSFKVTSN